MRRSRQESRPVRPTLESFGEMAIGTLVASRESLPLHSRTYRLLTKSTLVVCLDYSDSEYLEQGIADACYPCWAL